MIMILSPLDQFEIKPLLSINNNITLSISNYLLYIVIVVGLIYGIVNILRNTLLG